MIFLSFAFVFACSIFLNTAHSHPADQNGTEYAHWPNSTNNDSSGYHPGALNNSGHYLNISGSNVSISNISGHYPSNLNTSGPYLGGTLNPNTKTTSCPVACDIHYNYCDAFTAPTCIYPDPGAPEIGSACACRPGYKATGFADSDTSHQWRLPVIGQEHRVWVAERVRCDTLCTISGGIDSCQEVELIKGACKSSSAAKTTNGSDIWARWVDDGVTYKAADVASLDMPPVTPTNEFEPQNFARRQIDTTDGFRPGTNENIEGLTPETTEFDLVAIDWTTNMQDFYSEPYAANGLCSKPLVYQYLTGDDVIFRREDVNWHYIRQGGIGDCAFGASLLSILQTKGASALQARFERDTFDHIFATFYKPGSSQELQDVVVDTKLPLKDPEETSYSCNYISFQWYKGSLFVPLLEKAFAKYVDNYHTDLHDASLLAHDFNPEVYGFNGLQYIRGGKVIQALVGGVARGVYRPYSGESGSTTVDIQAALTDCLTRNIPCTCGTPTLFDPKNNGAQFLLGLPNQQEIPGGGGRKTAPLVDGWVANNMPLSVQDGHLFEVVNSALGQRYAMVGGHAYSVSRGHRTDTVMLGNPWGYTPNDPFTGWPKGWPGTLDSLYDVENNTAFYEFPIALAASFLAGVETSL